MPYLIRPARERDAAEILAVYAPYVTDTTVSFEYEVPSLEEFTQRIARTREQFGYVVAVDSQTGRIAGYAYYGTLRSRPAYQWSAETSIYLAPEHQGKGLGTRLLGTIERLMARQGIALAVACITSENTGSIEFHRRAGYTLCGTFDNCAFKLGRWLGVTWMEKQLLPCTEAPRPRRPLTDEDIDLALS